MIKSQKFSETVEFRNYFVTNWKRFLDDCFIPWTKTVSDLESLHNILNNLYIDIKFTLQFSNTEQSFLDVLVKNRDGKIETDIYYKDTDSKQYLLFYLCHPRHFNQFLWNICFVS